MLAGKARKALHNSRGKVLEVMVFLDKSAAWRGYGKRAKCYNEGGRSEEMHFVPEQDLILVCLKEG